jgi:hypothetical protein
MLEQLQKPLSASPGELPRGQPSLWHTGAGLDKGCRFCVLCERLARVPLTAHVVSRLIRHPASPTGCALETLKYPLIWRQAERTHPAIDDGADHRPALIGKREERIGVDALDVERTTEVVIVGEGVSNVLLRDGVLGDRVLVVAHQEHASQVMGQVLFGVRVITECWGSHAHSISSRGGDVGTMVRV